MQVPPFLRRFFSSSPSSEQQIQEQINPTYIASSPTEEDWYWGRLATGSEEDFWWRRLSDNWYQKDVIPATYLELHNLCYEAYNANPLAFAIIEITTSFVLGKGVTVAASQPEVQRMLMDFWNDPDNHMETRVYALCTELTLYGEQFIRFFEQVLQYKAIIGHKVDIHDRVGDVFPLHGFLNLSHSSEHA